MDATAAAAAAAAAAASAASVSAAPASAQQVVEAIRVLYGDPDSSRKAGANSWLISFSETQEAWSLALELLDCEIVEVQYFCANMLLSKVRSQFSRLDKELRKHFIARLCVKLAHYMRDKNAPALVLNRVCLVLAAVSVRISSAASEDPRFTVEDLLENTFQAVRAANGSEFLAQTISTSITLLQSIAEETDNLDRMRQAAILDSLKRRTHDVFAMMEACLNGQLSLPPPFLQPKGILCVPFLDLIHSWFKLSLNDNGRPFLTTGQLFQSHTVLWHFILQNLGSADIAASKSATEAIVDLLSFRGSESDPQILAIRGILSTILSFRHQINLSFSDPTQDPWEGNVEDVERSVCRICLAVIENFPLLMTKQNTPCEECVPVAEMLLQFTDRGDRLVIEYTVEYFILLNTVPVSQRKIEFQKGLDSLYVQLMQVLLKKVQFPLDFSFIDDNSDDSNSFHRFRDQVISDGLDTCYNLLGSHYLEYLCNLLQNAHTWQEVESSLYGFLSVSQSVKELLAEINIGRKPSKLSEEESKTMNIMNFLMEIISQNRSELFTSHSFVIESTSRLIGSYAMWISKSPVYLQGILSFLLKALQVPSSMNQASNAFRNLCARCTSHLSNPTAVNHLIDHALVFLQESSKFAISPQTAVKPSDIDSHAAIIEGLDRLISSLQPDETAKSSSRLISPMITIICQLVKDSESPEATIQVLEQNSKLLVWHLRQLATALQFLDIQDPFAKISDRYHSVSGSNGLTGSNHTDEVHPCIPIIQSAWDVLAQILMSEKWIKNQPIVDSVCAVYSKSLLSFKNSLNPMIDKLLPLIISVFQKNFFSSCVEVVATVIEVSVNEKKGDEAYFLLIKSSFESICSSCFMVIQGGPISDHLETFSSFFDMCYKSLLFSPLLILPSPFLSDLLHASSMIIKFKERESCKSILSFLSFLLSPGAKIMASPTWNQCKNHVDNAMLQNGQTIVTSLLSTATDSFPRDILRLLASTLYYLLTNYSSSSSVWLMSAMTQVLPSTASSRIGDSEKQLFCQVALHQPPLSRPRFESMVSDFAMICQGEATIDTLLAYQM